MYSADTLGEVREVDLMEALILRKTMHRNATIKKWRTLSQPVAQRAVARFEDTCAVRNQILGDFFSTILKEGPVQNCFVSSHIKYALFEEVAYSSILTRHEKWLECVYFVTGTPRWL